MPNYLRTIDGKHVAIKRPVAPFYNYKNFYSLTLIAVCNANYCFTLVDISGFGRDNDAGELSLPDARQVGRNMLHIF